MSEWNHCLSSLNLLRKICVTDIPCYTTHHRVKHNLFSHPQVSMEENWLTQLSKMPFSNDMSERNNCLSSVDSSWKSCLTDISYYSTHHLENHNLFTQPKVSMGENWLTQLGKKRISNDMSEWNNCSSSLDSFWKSCLTDILYYLAQYIEKYNLFLLQHVSMEDNWLTQQ